MSQNTRERHGLFEWTCTDLFPGNNVGRALLMPRDAGIQFSPLRFAKRLSVCLKTLPHCVQQRHFFCGREARQLASEIGHSDFNRSPDKSDVKQPYGIERSVDSLLDIGK